MLAFAPDQLPLRHVTAQLLADAATHDLSESGFVFFYLADHGRSEH